MSVTIEAAVQNVKDSFNFEVNKFPLSGPEGMKTSLYGLFRSDNAKCISRQSVTARYVPHTTDDVLALVEAGAEVFDQSIDLRCYFSRGHYIDLKPTKETRKEIYGTVDNVFPRILIRASFDGKSFNASMGYWRDMCSNMHIMQMSKRTSVSIRHTSNLRVNMNELIDNFQMLKESWGNLTALIEQMESRQVRLDDFLKGVYGPEPTEKGRKLTVYNDRNKAIRKRVTKEHEKAGRPTIGDDFVVTAWEAFNGVQGYEQHEATRKQSPTDFARMLTSINKTEVRNAERLALGI